MLKSLVSPISQSICGLTPRIWSLPSLENSILGYAVIGKVEVLHKGSKINNMKTAGTKNCQLCMKERVELFHAFSKRSQTCKLMNSKNELYGQCSCKTRFLRLQAVGNEGTDEAID